MTGMTMKQHDRKMFWEVLKKYKTTLKKFRENPTENRGRELTRVSFALWILAQRVPKGYGKYIRQAYREAGT